MMEPSPDQFKPRRLSLDLSKQAEEPHIERDSYVNGLLIALPFCLTWAVDALSYGICFSFVRPEGANYGPLKVWY